MLLDASQGARGVVLVYGVDVSSCCRAVDTGSGVLVLLRRSGGGPELRRGGDGELELALDVVRVEPGAIEVAITRGHGRPSKVLDRAGPMV